MVKQNSLYRYEELGALQELFKKDNYQKQYWNEFSRGQDVALENATYAHFKSHFKTDLGFNNHFRHSIQTFGSFITEPFFRWQFGEKDKANRVALRTCRKLEEALHPFTTITLGRAYLNSFEEIDNGGLRKKESILIIRLSVSGAWIDILIPERKSNAYDANNTEVEDLDDKSLEIINVDGDSLLNLKQLFDSIYQFVLAPNYYSKFKIKASNICSVFSDNFFERLVASNEENVLNYRRKTKWKPLANDDCLAVGLSLVNNFGFKHDKEYIFLTAN